TLKLDWLKFITLDLGVFIELPEFKFILAGSARLLIGASEDAALTYLRLDFLGIIDTKEQLISFDAALVNSHVLQIFRVTGGAAVRLCYGPNGYFVFSVGGFHPSFDPGPFRVPRIARCGATMSVSVGVKVWLKLEMYLAVTPNTFQLGAGVEAGLELGPISAHGWFKFDALIQFHPFHFVARIDAGFDVEV